MSGAGDKNNLSAWEGPFCCLSEHLTVLALWAEGSRAPQCLSAGIVERVPPMRSSVLQRP